MNSKNLISCHVSSIDDLMGGVASSLEDFSCALYLSRSRPQIKGGGFKNLDGLIEVCRKFHEEFIYLLYNVI